MRINIAQNKKCSVTTIPFLANYWQRLKLLCESFQNGEDKTGMHTAVCILLSWNALSSFWNSGILIGFTCVLCESCEQLRKYI
jgi:hypothetical protein